MAGRRADERVRQAWTASAAAARGLAAVRVLSV